MTTAPRIFHDTEYSKNYSERIFNQIQIGMSKKNVLQLLGEPLSILDRRLFLNGKKDCCGVYDTLFFYSKDKSGGNYYQRRIGVKYGKVTEIIKEFYYD